MAVLVLCAVLPLSAAVRYDMTPVTFEGGSLPTAWTVDTLWAVEGGEGVSLTNPAGAYEGQYRIAARCAAGTYGNVKASLVTPAINLSESDDPLLVFSYAAPAYNGVSDTLAVYYRIAQNDEWHLLETFMRAASWKQVELQLPSYIAGWQYQVKFEMRHADGINDGVSLDNILIYQTPKCKAPVFQGYETPRDSLITELSATPGGTAVAAYDLLLSMTQINPDTVADVTIYPYHAENQASSQVSIGGLQQYTVYYLYARTNCDDNLTGYTDWTELEFRTPMLVNVPMTIDFNDITGTPEGWVFGASNGLNNVPAVISNANLSLDGSKVLYFGASSTSPATAAGTLSAGQYVYAVAPQLNNIYVRDLEISFWGTAYMTIPGVYAPNLEVGVISDPADPSTFTTVQTVKVDANQFKKFTVNFASYTGSGRYVAFRAKGADLKNHFAIDNIEFVALTTPVPTEPVVTAITPSSLTVSTDLCGADSWNLRLDTLYFHDSVPAGVINQAVSGPAATVALPADYEGRIVTVYAQGVKNGIAGEWSFPLTVRIPSTMTDTLPTVVSVSSATPQFFVGKLINEVKSVGSEKSPELAFFRLYNKTYIPKISGTAVTLNGAENYFTLGYMPTLNTKEVTFYLHGNASGAGKVALGVMTNPYDMSTFVELAQFDGLKSGSEFSECIYDLDQYTGEGHYLAFKSLAANNYIKDITFTTIPECRKVSAVECVAGSSKAFLDWDDNNMSMWQVVVSSNKNMTDTLYNEIVTVSADTVPGLEPEHTYYYKVNTVCGADTLQMYGSREFTTSLGVPYVQTFSSATWPSAWSRYQATSANFFSGTKSTTTSGWNTNSYSGNGLPGYHAGCEIYSTSYNYWMVSPAISTAEFAGQSIRMTWDMALTYWNTAGAPSSSADDRVWVAVSADGGLTWDRANAKVWSDDQSVTPDYPYLSIPVTGQKYTLDLTAFAGQTIAVAFGTETTTSGTDNRIHVANVEIAAFDPNCPGVSSIEATAITENSVTLDWYAGGTQEVTIQVATSTGYGDSTLVYNQVVTSSPVVVTGLESNTHYYVRAVQNCDPNQSYALVDFRTQCMPYTPAQFGMELFNEDGTINCWTLGHDESLETTSGANPAATTVNGFGNVLRFLKSSASYHDGLYAISPAFNIPDSMNHYQVVFDAAATARTATTIARLQVGVVTDPSNLSTFEILKTVDLSFASDSNDLRTYVVDFAAYTGDNNEDYGNYIGFLVQATDSTTALVVDNMKLEVISSCPMVQDIAISQVTADGALFRWADSEAEQYEVSVFSARSLDSTVVFTQTVAGDSLLVTGLEGNTTYYAAIRAICAGNDLANWSSFFPFTTECSAVVEFPWTENFDSRTTGVLNIDCWSNTHVAGTSTTLMQVATNTSYDNDTKMMKLNDQTTGNKTRVELPFMTIPEANAYEFRFDVLRYNYSSTKPGEGFLVTVEGDFGIDTLGFVQRENTLATEIAPAVTAGWYTYSFTIPEAGNLHVVIYGISEYGAASYADNFEVRHLPLCPAPQKLKAAALGVDTALVVWTSNLTEFTVELSADADFETLISTTTVQDTSIIFRNLAPAATYYVRVQGTCDDPEWAEASFKTLCGVPFIQDFEESKTSLPADWVRLRGELYTDSLFTQISSYWSFTGSAAAGLSTYHAYSNVQGNSDYANHLVFLSPAVVLNNVEGNSLQLSFDLGLVSGSTGTTAPASTVSDGRHFSVALVTEDGIVPVMAWDNDTTWNGYVGTYSSISREASRYSVDLTAFAGQRVKVAFYHSIGTSTVTTSSYVHLDNIKILSENTSCATPVIELAGVTTETVTVAFPAVGDYMAEISTTHAFASVLDTVMVTADSLATFTGLESATTYFVRAKAVCGEGVESGVSDVISAATECAPYALPYTQNFVGDYSQGDLPLCWTKVQSSGNYPYVSTSYNALYMYGGGTTSAMIVALPEMEMPLSALTLNMNYKANVNTSYSTYGTLKIGYYTDLDSAFVQLAELDQKAAATDYELVLASAPAEAAYLAIKYDGGSSNYGAAYIYSLELSVTPSCVPVQAIDFSNIDRRELDINWTPKVAADAYDLIISNEELTDSALALTAPTLTLDTTYYHLSGLTRGTTYYVYVRANCGAEDGVSTWMGASVTTKSLQACDDHFIGNGTGASYDMPLNNFYRNSWDQMIYPASMLNGAQNISAIAFDIATAAQYSMTDFTIYMGHTTANAASGVSGWVAQTALTPVFTATDYATPTETGWWRIDLQTPFAYNGTDNLVICVGKTAASYVSGLTFRNTTGAAGATLYRRDDTDLSYGSYPAAGETGTMSAYLPNINLIDCYNTPACPTVVSAEVELLGNGQNSAYISWPAASGDYANTYEFCYADNDTVAPADIATKYTGIDSLGITLTGLTDATTYYGYIRVVCDAEGHNDGNSSWFPMSFTTNADCPAVQDLAVTITSKTSAVAEWGVIYEEQDKTFAYILSTTEMTKAELAAATLVNVDDTLAVGFDNLAYGQTYHLYVASRCGVKKSVFEHVEFTMPASCPAVADLRAETIAFNCIQLKWNRGAFAEETQWEVGIVGREAQAQIVSDSTALIIGLESSTAYVAYVKALCSETESSVIATLPFTSAMAPSEEAELGNGTSTAYLVYTSWGNSYSQHIYTAAELQELGYTGGNILNVSFFYTGTSSSFDKVQSIYIGHTAQDYFDTNTLISDSEIELVYGPETRVYQSGWVTYDFDAPFEWDGVSNIVVAVITNQSGTSGTTSSSGWSTRGTVQEDSRSIYRYRDSNPIDFTNMPTSGAIYSCRPNIKIGFEQPSCSKVVNMKVENITTTSADASWFPGGPETSWNTFLSTVPMEEAQLNTAAFDTVSRYTKHLDNLVVDGDYYFYVRGICSATDRSEWRGIHFITEAICKIPVELRVDSVTAFTADIAWKNDSTTAPESYIVAYGLADTFNLADPTTYQTITVTDTVAQLQGLASKTSYMVAVKANCDATTSSRYTEPILFTTECADVVEFPYLQNFNDFTSKDLECWTITESTMTVASNNWSIVVNNGDTCVRMNSYNAYEDEYSVLETPTFALDSNYVLAFRYKNPAGGDYSVLMRTANGNVVIASDLTNVPEWDEYEYDLSAYVGQRVSFLFWGVSNFGSGDAYLYLDDVEIRPAETCLKPAVLNGGVTTTTAKIIFAATGNYAAQIATDKDFTDLIASDTIAADSVHVFTGLTPGTQYYARAQSLCDGGETSRWSKTIAMKTAYGIPFNEQFASGLSGEWKRSSTSRTDVFNGTEMNTTTGGWTSQLSTSSACPTGMSSHMKVNIFGSSCKYWMITPTLDLSDTTALSAVRLTFQAAWTAYASKNAVTNSSTDDLFMVAISTDGGTTWNQGDSWTWANNDEDATEGNLDASFANVARKVAIDLSDYIGGSVTIGFYAESTVSGGDNDFHVGDVRVEEFNANCAGVENITVSNIGLTEADIAFNYVEGTADAYLEVSTNSAFNNIVASATLTGDSTYHVTGLEASTTYYVRIKQLCDVGIESGYNSASFTTALGLPFQPSFDNGLGADWNRYQYLVGANTTQFNRTDMTSTSGGWSVVAADTVINARHIRGNIYGTTFKYWLITPSIDLSANQGEGIMLSLDLGLTPYSTGNAGSRNNGTDDRFMVVVSEDGGATWKMENATIWDNNAANQAAGKSQSYNAIPEHGKTYRINMTNYAGKNIAIGFYGESTSANADNYFHFGNIKLLSVPTTPVYDSICSGRDYENYDFSIAYNEYNLGENLYSHFTPAIDTLHQDSITTLHLIVKPTSESSFNDTICYGETYAYAGFNINNPTSKAYPLILDGSNGCDSIVTLNLYVREKIDTTLEVLRCKGETYEFKGIEYATNQYNLVDTLVSVHGCDSIVRLHLTFSETESESYYHREIVCPGGSYTDDTFTEPLTATGRYEVQMTSIFGCDSTITLDLLVPDAAKHAYDTVYTDELPYVLNGQEKLSAETPAGSYDFRILLQECANYMTVYVEVLDRSTGLDAYFGNGKKIRKVLINQQIYIIVDDNWYDATGKHVEPVVF